METAFIAVLSLVCAALTLFSGFGLGTVLLPAFLLWFSPPVAVAAVAIVHLANNLFRIGLVWRDVDRAVFVRFALPGVVAAFVGAWGLTHLAQVAPLGSWSLLGRTSVVAPVELTVGLVLVGFAVLELWPGFDRWALDPRWLPLGGAVSGFFGGLSGQQGALRSAFLLRAGLSAPGFVATGVASSVVVDLARLTVYGAAFASGDVLAELSGRWTLIAVATGSAFLGSFVGTRLVRKVTISTVRRVVGVLLLVLGIAIAAGIL